MRTIITAGLLCAALLLAVASAVRADTDIHEGGNDLGSSLSLVSE